MAESKITDDEIAPANKDGTAATPSMRTLGTGATQACAGNDPRLSDARPPTAHSHAQADVTGLVSDLAGKQPLDSDLTTLAASITAHGHALAASGSPEATRELLDVGAGYEQFGHDGTIYTSKRIANAVSNVNLGTFALVGDRQIAVPFIVPIGLSGILENIEVETVTVVSGSDIIVYVYEQANGFPTNQIWAGSGFQINTPGYEGEYGLSIQLEQGKGYFVVLDMRQSGDVIRGLTVNGQSHALGKDAAGTGSQGAIYTDDGFTGVQDPFNTTIGGMYVGTIPAIHLTFV